jgi:hypothetical protein
MSQSSKPLRVQVPRGSPVSSTPASPEVPASKRGGLSPRIPERSPRSAPPPASKVWRGSLRNVDWNAHGGQADASAHNHSTH